MQIISPMATGNGAYIVHKTLETKLSNYCTIPYNPYWTLTPFLLPLFSKKKASIIHSTADYACFFSQRKVPLVVTLHNYVLDPFMQQYSSVLQNIHYQTDLKWFTKMSLQRAEKITSVSCYTAELTKKDLDFNGDIEVISNGIDTQYFYPKDNRSQVKGVSVLFSGNLTQRKGAHWLPQIVEKLNHNAELLYTQGLNKTKLNIEGGRMRDIGKIPYHEMPLLYNSVDILLMPTVREGMSLAVLEAMACGLPVVVTNCSSMPELIDEGKGGFLCPVGDVNIFADRLNLLIENAALRHQMGEYNRAKVEKYFTLQAMVKSYQTLFEKILDEDA